MSATLKAMLAAVLVAVAAGAVAITLGGGGDEPAAGDTTTTTSPLPGASGATTDTSEAATTTTAGDVGACSLVGVWRLRGQEFFDSIADASGADGDFSHVSGSYLVEMRADGTSVGTRQAWTFRIATAEGAIVMTITSEDPGTWTADAERIEVIETGGTEALVSMAIEVNGQLMPMPVGSQVPVDTAGFQGAGAYTCVGDVLTIFVEDEAIPVTAVFDRET